MVARWEKRVLNYLLRLVGNREDAPDLTQNATLKGYQNLRKLDEPGFAVILLICSCLIIPFDVEQLEIARKAFELYGKGRHPAGLNFGDCISYSLAKWNGEALLFNGEAFTLTDVRRVI